MEISLDADSIKMIEQILNGHKTAIIYYSKKGLVVAEQSTKIKNVSQGND